MVGILGAIGGLITGPIEQILETRKIKRAAKAQVLVMLAEAEAKEKVAKVEARITKLKSEAAIEEKKVDADVNWEALWSQQAAKSWKDEFFVLFLSAPVLMAFIPFLAPYSLEGFSIIDQMPEWYKIAYLSAIGASFGLRSLTKFKNFNGKQ